MAVPPDKPWRAFVEYETPPGTKLTRFNDSWH